MNERRTQWVRRHLYRLWLIPIILIVLQLGSWAFDRKSPRIIGTYTATPALPGGTAVLTINIQRDKSRRCSMEVSRYFYDSKAVRYSIGSTEKRNAAVAIYTEALSPGKLILGIDIPVSAARGTALLVTTANYVCNPLHLVYPIPLVMAQEIEVL